MTNSAPASTSALVIRLRRLACALPIMCVLAVMPCVTAQAQSYTVLHAFSGPEGAVPWAGLTEDAAGNLYGTTYEGGLRNAYCSQGCGTVFKLAHKGSGWVLTTLYAFQGGSDSGYPWSRVIFGPDGTLYGTTHGGTSNTDAGSVFNLRPPATVCRSISCPWTKTILYTFTGETDGNGPGYGDVIFDNQGNIYGTTERGGQYLDYGAVFELTKESGGWTESVLHSFNPQPGVTDGFDPVGGLVFDSAGNLYGTTSQGGFYDPQDQLLGSGIVFELTPAGNGWTETVIYRFLDSGDGGLPFAGLTPAVMGGDQVFFGTTYAGGQGNCVIGTISGCGAVYEVPYTTDYSFAPYQNGGGPGGPEAPVTVDAAGRVYGTTYQDGANGWGAVFELTYEGNGWAYSSLHDFNGTDGGLPISNVLLDSSGNLYGTASNGSATNCNGHGCGVVWMITP